MLHVDVYGKGPELLLLHGWGMHGGLFASWVKQLGELFRVTVVDLPGHGHSVFSGEDDLQQWAQAVLAVAPPRAAWVGWSLGGVIAQSAVAAAPQRCHGLVLLASTPRFVKSKDWASALDAAVFDQFATQLQADRERALGRFLALQVRGAENSKEILRRLRAELGSRPAPAPDALGAGLDLLLHSDLRGVVSNLDLPVFAIFGERDTLVPADVADQMPFARSAVIPGAGHVPFISHARRCSELLGSWLLPGDAGQYAAR